MTKLTTPEETLKLWREGFYQLSIADKIDLPDYHFAEKYYIAAKASSHEREQELEKEITKLKLCVKNLGFNSDYVEEVEDKNWNMGEVISEVIPYVQENYDSGFMSQKYALWLDRARKLVSKRMDGANVQQ